MTTVSMMVWRVTMGVQAVIEALRLVDVME